MSKGLDISHVRERYAKFSDKELVRLANDATGLTEDARLVIKEELTARQLDPALIQAVDDQNKEYTLGELNALCERFRGLPCPSCGGRGEPLNATKVSNTYSFIVLTRSTSKIRIACPSCLNKANRKALIGSSLLGWWGFPWGIIRTIDSISVNVKGMRIGKKEEVTNYFREFVFRNIAAVIRNKDNPQALQQIISRQ